MKLYDEVIREWETLLESAQPKELPVDPDPAWRDAGANNLIFRSDMAFELGGGRRFEKSGLVLTDSADAVPGDELLLIGPDLPEIREDMPYARLTIVRVNDRELGDGDKLYDTIKNIDFTKYHVSPEGFMLRISAGNGVESVRVSKKAVADGLNIATVGSMFIRQFHKNPHVDAVKMIVITDPGFDFEALKAALSKAQEITKAIDHIFKDVKMTDCRACTLQEICNEVEGLRELHFKRGAEN